MKSLFTKTANVVVMTVVGLVLIIASMLKVHQLLTEPVISAGFWSSRQFLILQVPLELGLGIWLVSGLFRKACWLMGAVCFGFFTIYTLHSVLIGAESCGCFGTIQVNPWITLLAMDVPFFAALLLFRPKGCRLLPPPWPSAKHFFGIAIPTFIIMAVIMPVVIFNRPPDKTDEYQVIKPEEWISSSQQPAGEWPMFGYIDIAGSLRSNIVIVVFHSSECETCHEAIPVYDQMARDMAGNENAIQFAFIEIPPYAGPQEALIPADTPALVGRLDASLEWKTLTPLIVVLRDGGVVKFWQGEIPGLDEILDAVAAGG